MYLVLDIRLFIFVQMNFDNLRAIKLYANSFTHNFYRVDNILQQSVIYRGQRTAKIKLDYAELKSEFKINVYIEYIFCIMSRYLRKQIK